MDWSIGPLASRASRIAALALLTIALAAGLFAARASAAVSFDPSFGSGGTTYSAGFQIVGGAALDSDGRIAVAGSAGNMPMQFSVARFDANGHPDASFGTGGVVADAMPGPALPGYYQARATDVAVQSDHKLVVVGEYQTGSIATQFAIVRLNENGTPDTGFGDGGRVLIPVQDGAEAVGVQIAANGDIVAGGYSFSNSPYYAPNVIAVRLDANGDPVNSFGGDGVASTNLSANAMIFASDVLIDGDGVLVVAGRGNQITLTRFDSNGDLDTSYGSGGTAAAAFPEGSTPGRAVRMADGRVVVSGSSGAGFAIARFTANGALDPGYGYGGMLTLGFAGQSSAADVALRANGKVIAVGRQGDLNGGGPVTFAMAGTTPDGLRDDSFGDGGRVTTQLPLTSRSGANNATIDAQGRLLVVGGAGYDGIAMARYLIDDTAPAAGGSHVSLDADFPSSVKSSKLKSLGGGLGGSAATVQVALRLNLPKNADAAAAKTTRRCQWLKSAKAKFSKVKKSSGCDRKVWLRATIDAGGRWKLALKGSLPTGSYTVFAQALDGAGSATAQLKKPLKIK